MSPRTRPPYRSEHIGFFKRPDRLLQKRVAHEASNDTKEELRGCEDECIRDVVQMQKDVGLQTVTNGEFRRRMWYEGLFSRLEGVEEVRWPSEEVFSPYAISKQTPVSHICKSKLTRVESLYGDDCELPKNKLVILGLITTKFPELENPKQLEDRILQAVDAVTQGQGQRTRAEALEQLCISAQCGFSSDAHGTDRVTHEDMRNKLSLVVDTAKAIWGSL